MVAGEWRIRLDFVLHGIIFSYRVDIYKKTCLFIYLFSLC